ncbi:hypothetical protein [Sphingorhabdus sp. Alg231-15]|uniref:hypothetical protein n=1 Tax=Sphingorhabdus sp. Alg231-15 TaxID=1922222 RepID=UPI000D5579DD
MAETKAICAVGVAVAATVSIANVEVPRFRETVEASYFEGRWAFSEETCDQPTNWTLLAGGNFISEDLTGIWQWMAGQLKLNLTDLAEDEETGEAGGRFQMEGPVMISGPDQFILNIEPDSYIMKRCQ